MITILTEVANWHESHKIYRPQQNVCDQAESSTTTLHALPEVLTKSTNGSETEKGFIWRHHWNWKHHWNFNRRETTNLVLSSRPQLFQGERRGHCKRIKKDGIGSPARWNLHKDRWFWGSQTQGTTASEEMVPQRPNWEGSRAGSSSCDRKDTHAWQNAICTNSSQYSDFDQWFPWRTLQSRPAGIRRNSVFRKVERIRTLHGSGRCLCCQRGAEDVYTRCTLLSWWWIIRRRQAVWFSSSSANSALSHAKSLFKSNGLKYFFMDFLAPCANIQAFYGNNWLNKFSRIFKERR